MSARKHYCPALALAVEMDAVVAAWNAIDERGNSQPRDDSRSLILSARMQAIQMGKLCYAHVRRWRGLLLSLASADHDTAANATTPRIKDYHDARCERLMNATRVFLMQQAKQCRLWKAAAEYFFGNQLAPADAIEEAIHSSTGKGARASLKSKAS